MDHDGQVEVSATLAWFAARCDEIVEANLAAFEIVMRNTGATPQELDDVLGPEGWGRKMVVKDRARWLVEIKEWLDRGGENALFGSQSLQVGANCTETHVTLGSRQLLKRL